MATNTDHTGNAPHNAVNGGAAKDRGMTHEEHQTAKTAAGFGYGPPAHGDTSGSDKLPAFGGEAQPGLYRPVKERKFGNPAPLGLCAFALTTFVLGLINMETRGTTVPNVVVGVAFGYGGLVQLLAGMWYVSSPLQAMFRPPCRSERAWVKVLTEAGNIGKWRSETRSVPLPYPLLAGFGSLSPSFSRLAAFRSRRHT